MSFPCPFFPICKRKKIIFFYLTSKDIFINITCVWLFKKKQNKKRSIQTVPTALLIVLKALIVSEGFFSNNSQLLMICLIGSKAEGGALRSPSAAANRSCDTREGTPLVFISSEWFFGFQKRTPRQPASSGKRAFLQDSEEPDPPRNGCQGTVVCDRGAVTPRVCCFTSCCQLGTFQPSFRSDFQDTLTQLTCSMTPSVSGQCIPWLYWVQTAVLGVRIDNS